MEKEETEQESHARLVQAMKNIKDDFKDSPKVQGTGKTKWRSMSELKKELSDGDVEIKTDFAVMNGLVERFFSSGVEEGEQMYILEELEQYVHQYDNALDFLSLNGLGRVVVPSMNSTSQSVRRLACFLLGAAAQSNPEVQQAALAVGLVSVILSVCLTSCSSSKNLSLHHPPTTRCPSCSG